GRVLALGLLLYGRVLALDVNALLVQRGVVVLVRRGLPQDGDDPYLNGPPSLGAPHLAEARVGGVGQGEPLGGAARRRTSRPVGHLVPPYLEVGVDVDMAGQVSGVAQRVPAVLLSVDFVDKSALGLLR